MDNSSNNTQLVEKQPKPKMDPRVRNTIIYCAVTGSIIVFGIIGIVLLLTFGRTRKTNPPIVEKMPTLDLAQSVCEKYGGNFSLNEDGDNGHCSNYDHEPNFSFEMTLIKDEDMEKMWMNLELVNSAYGYNILEKTDDYFKAYTNSNNQHAILILYKNVMVTIMVLDSDGTFIDELVAELGFPDGASVNESGSVDEDDYKPISNTITPEVAETLCSKYEGKIVDEENARYGSPLTMTADFSDTRICERYTHHEVDLDSIYPGLSSYVDDASLSDQEIQELYEEAQKLYGISIGPKDFSYGVGFLKEDKKTEYWDFWRNELINSEAHEDISEYTMLEDSDEMIKACSSVAGLMLMCFGMHDNIVVAIESGGDYSTVDKIFANFGFPDRARLEDYVNAKRAENSD